MSQDGSAYTVEDDGSTLPAVVRAPGNYKALRRQIRIGPLVSAHPEELERMGLDGSDGSGFDDELGGRPYVVVPLLREFLDPVL